MAWVKRGLFALAATAPMAAGVLVSALPLTFAAAGVLVVGLVLAIALPRLRRGDDDDRRDRVTFDDWDASRLELIAAQNRAAHSAYAPH